MAVLMPAVAVSVGESILLVDVVCAWPCRREQIAQYGDVAFHVPFGLGVLPVSLVMISDLPKPDSALGSRVPVSLTQSGG